MCHASFYCRFFKLFHCRHEILQAFYKAWHGFLLLPVFDFFKNSTATLPVWVCVGQDNTAEFPGYHKSQASVRVPRLSWKPSWSVGMQSFSHTPVSFIPGATVILAGGGRCQSIHQVSSECSVRTRRDAQGHARSSTGPFLSSYLSCVIFSSFNLSLLFSVCHRGLSQPHLPSVSGVAEKQDGKGKEDFCFIESLISVHVL